MIVGFVDKGKKIQTLLKRLRMLIQKGYEKFLKYMEMITLFPQLPKKKR